MPGGWKSASNLREDFPRSELFALNLRHVYAQWGEICLESEARFSEVGMVSPRSGAENELPKWFALSLGHDFWGVCSRSLISV